MEISLNVKRVYHSLTKAASGVRRGIGQKYLLNNPGKESLKVLKTFGVWQDRPNFLRRYGQK
jgi:hypothetical protein